MWMHHELMWMTHDVFLTNICECITNLYGWLTNSYESIASYANERTTNSNEWITWMNLTPFWINHELRTWSANSIYDPRTHTPQRRCRELLYRHHHHKWITNSYEAITNSTHDPRTHTHQNRRRELQHRHCHTIGRELYIWMIHELVYINHTWSTNSYPSTPMPRAPS